MAVSRLLARAGYIQKDKNEAVIRCNSFCYDVIIAWSVVAETLCRTGQGRPSLLLLLLLLLRCALDRKSKYWNREMVFVECGYMQSITVRTCRYVLEIE
jgi:hypothetical protein